MAKLMRFAAVCAAVLIALTLGSGSSSAVAYSPSSQTRVDLSWTRVDDDNLSFSVRALTIGWPDDSRISIGVYVTAKNPATSARVPVTDGSNQCVGSTCEYNGVYGTVKYEDRPVCVYALVVVEGSLNARESTSEDCKG